MSPNSPLAPQAAQFPRRRDSRKSRTSPPGIPGSRSPPSKSSTNSYDSDLDALHRLIAGRPVLDAGCGDGDVAFFMESLGARVDAVDHAPTNYNWMLGVRALKRLLNSSAGIHAVDLDARPNLPSADYGLTMFLGILYHLKNPLWCWRRWRAHSCHIFLSTRIASRDARTARLTSARCRWPIWSTKTSSINDGTNFWIFSEVGLKRLVQRAGWKVLRYTTVGANARRRRSRHA